MRTVAANQAIATSEVIRAGLSKIRTEFQVPGPFPAEVLAAADRAASKFPGAEHVDRTDIRFVTLDPATSTDLDQAFAIETAGSDLLLRYAIADVGWFVEPGDPLDVEAWHRGTTTYLPDGKAGLYPPALAEGAASLLPDGPRPAVVFAVRVDTDGHATLDGVERAVIRSRAKLGYDSVRPEDLPDGFAELARRSKVAEDRRGASRIEPPEQEVEPLDGGGYRVVFSPRLASEDANAAMSLATNLAVADALAVAHTGLFRVMPEPDERAVKRLRHTAAALGIAWPAATDMRTMERTLRAGDPKHAAFMLAIRRAGGGASYVPYVEGVVPWHAAMAATYAHATAPLRRLADRYVVLAALAIVNGRPVPDEVVAAFTTLPEVMRKADGRSSQIDRAVIDLVEAATLVGREGRTFVAVVTDTDDRGARIQLTDDAVVARVSADGVGPGDQIRVKLIASDPVARTLQFERVA